MVYNLKTLWDDAKIFFGTIAVLLGTGILALPVRLADVGPLFVLTFSISLIAQLFLVILGVETLQRSRILLAYGISRPSDLVVSTDKADITNQVVPDLHTLGLQVFDSKWTAYLFDLAFMINFISILVSYGLAGSSSYAELLDLDATKLTPTFIVVGSLIVVLMSRLLPHLISTLTFIKTSLLVFMVGVVGYASESTRLTPSSNISNLMDPFLLSSIALGGIFTTTPVMIGSHLSSGESLRRFRIAMLSGIFVCYVFNIVWAFFVMRVVPQRGPPPSLEAAAENGEISTVPLVQVLDSIENGGSYLKVFSSLVAVMITVSISISYLALGNGLRHLMDGIGAGISDTLRIPISPNEPLIPFLNRMMKALRFGRHREFSLTEHSEESSNRAVRGVSATAVDPLNENTEESSVSPASIALRLFIYCGLYILVFGTVLLIASSNPEGFLLILESATSFALNLGGGLFVAFCFVGILQNEARLFRLRLKQAAEDLYASLAVSTSSRGKSSSRFAEEPLKSVQFQLASPGSFEESAARLESSLQKLNSARNSPHSIGEAAVVQSPSEGSLESMGGSVHHTSRAIHSSAAESRYKDEAINVDTHNLWVPVPSLDAPALLTSPFLLRISLFAVTVFFSAAVYFDFYSIIALSSGRQAGIWAALLALLLTYRPLLSPLRLSLGLGRLAARLLDPISSNAHEREELFKKDGSQLFVRFSSIPDIFLEAEKSLWLLPSLCSEAEALRLVDRDPRFSSLLFREIESPEQENAGLLLSAENSELVHSERETSSFQSSGGAVSMEVAEESSDSGEGLSSVMNRLGISEPGEARSAPRSLFAEFRIFLSSSDFLYTLSDSLRLCAVIHAARTDPDGVHPIVSAAAAVSLAAHFLLSSVPDEFLAGRSSLMGKIFGRIFRVLALLLLAVSDIILLILAIVITAKHHDSSSTVLQVLASLVGFVHILVRARRISVIQT